MRIQKSTPKSIYPVEDRWAYLWLALTVVCGVFSLSIGMWIIPIAAWFGSIFMLRFMRAQRRAWLGYLILVAATALTVAIALPGFLGPLRVPIIIGSAFISSLAPLADRLIVPRLRGFVATLVFPLAYTALEFINALTNPLGSFGASAYTQYDNLALLQVVSVTGMWGVTFLVAWLASVVNWAWEQQFEWAHIKRGVLTYGGIFVAVLLFGQLRLWFAPQAVDTVRIAGVTAVDFRANQSELMQAVNEDWETFRTMAADRHQRYFDETVREAQAGAQLVLWPEFAAPVAAEDEAALMARGQQVAQDEGIYLAMSMGVLFPDDTPYEQKMVVIDPRGEIVLDHLKFGGKGFEGNRADGDGILRTATTPFGVISGAICWDTDFTGTMIQSGRNGTDILLSPSLDDADIDPIHAHMAVMRAIENGVSVVRVSDNGRSVITDPYGRVLAATDHFNDGERVIVAQVPTAGVQTIYPKIGDLFGWLALAGFVVMVGLAIVSGRRARAEKAMGESSAPDELAPAH